MAQSPLIGVAGDDTRGGGRRELKALLPAPGNEFTTKQKENFIRGRRRRGEDITMDDLVANESRFVESGTRCSVSSLCFQKHDSFQDVSLALAMKS